MTSVAVRTVEQDTEAVALHGLSIDVVCPEPSVARALEGRFEHLAGTSATPDVTVVYDFDRQPHGRPPDGRTVYESRFATVLYSPAEDALYAFHADGATLRCDCAGGLAEIAAGPPIPSRTWVVTRPLLTLALMELARRHDLYPLHAAALASAGSGVLVCGPSGAGKSTLAVALLEAGLEFLGDDLVFLREGRAGLEALAFPDELGLTRDARVGLPQLPAHVVTAPEAGWPKARADVHELAPEATVAASCAPRLVVLLSDDAPRDALVPAAPESALVELLPNILLTRPDTCAGHLAALASLTASATLRRTAARPNLSIVCADIVHTLRRDDS